MTQALALPEDRRSGHMLAGLSIAGIALLIALFIWRGANGHDAFAYWRHDGGLFANALDSAGGQGVYRYSPAFAQLVSPLWALPWEAFRFIWLGMSLIMLAWVARKYAAVLLVLPPVLLELWIGNIHVLMAAVIVASFRYPGLWAFILLTKVTPGVGLLWFAVRREWVSLAVAMLATAGTILASVLIGGVTIWVEWLSVLSAGPRIDAIWWIPIPPLAVRLIVAGMVVTWGALTERRWTVPVAATLALPTVWGHGLSLLVAIIPLMTSRQRASGGRSASRPT